MSVAIASVAEAKKALTPPLRFGDEKQIAAAKYLGLIGECREALANCEHEPKGVVGAGVECSNCGGSGECVCECGHEHTCAECDGKEATGELCDCISSFPRDVLMEALNRCRSITAAEKKAIRSAA